MALYFAYDRRISQDLLEEEIHADPGSIERVSTPSTEDSFLALPLQLMPFISTSLSE